MAVGDVLHLSADDLSRLLIELLAAPLRIQSGQGASYPVVLSKKYRVHRQQADLLVRSYVSGDKAIYRTFERISSAVDELP